MFFFCFFFENVPPFFHFSIEKTRKRERARILMHFHPFPRLDFWWHVTEERSKQISVSRREKQIETNREPSFRRLMYQGLSNQSYKTVWASHITANKVRDCWAENNGNRGTMPINISVNNFLQRIVICGLYGNVPSNNITCKVFQVLTLHSAKMEHHC